MADILIRGMEMPKEPTPLTLYPDGRWNDYTDGANGEFLPLPKGHGRLIDADALDRAFTDLRFNSDGTLNHWGDRPGWCMHGYEVEKLIADAPTIVPAEGGTENG